MENVNVTHPGNIVNDPKVKKVRSSNKFDEKYAVAQGQRFGQLNAPFFFDAVAKDRVVLRSAHNVRSYTLKSPLLSDLSLKKDYFQVTRRAILPRNWEKFFAQPNLGDDVTIDVGTTVEEFSAKVFTIMTSAFSSIHTAINSKDWSDPESLTPDDYAAASDAVNCFIDIAIRLGYFYSFGSLLAAAGFSMESLFKWTKNSNGEIGNYDEWFDTFVTELGDMLDSEYPSGFVYLVKDNSIYARVYKTLPDSVLQQSYDEPSISIRRAIELIQDDPSFSFSFLFDEDNAEAILMNTDFGSMIAVATGSYSPSQQYSVEILVDDCPCDLARLFAYQMVCAHYYTNDSIDFVYSADLYRQVVRASWQEAYDTLTGSSAQFPSFSWNGILCQYDDCSAHLFNVLAQMVPSIVDASNWGTIAAYLSVIFAWRNSLRFTDYFTGAKSRPLAVGDLNIEVNSGSPNYVSVLDVTRNIQRQRFFNAVNRTGRKIEQYLEGIFGAKPSHDWHNPLWLGHTKDTIIADEVENNTFNPSDPSGNSEQLVSATLRGAANNYAFEVQVDEPSILLGISYFDIPRFYLHSTERIMMHRDRFDMFNPFMQFIGDQDIKVRELTDLPFSNGQPADFALQFGFAMRNMEYKQRFSRALGPFATGVLPSWIFTDSIYGRGDGVRISPEYIRSSCVELDKYYTSLSFNSPANYFHFIVINYNECGAVRNMVYAPNIL